MRNWLHWHRGILRPLLEMLIPCWQQAPKDWAPSQISPCQPAPVLISGREAKTTQEWVVYQQGYTAMKDVMATLGWAVVLPMCEQPKNDLTSGRSLQRAEREYPWCLRCLLTNGVPPQGK